MDLLTHRIEVLYEDFLAQLYYFKYLHSHYLLALPVKDLKNITISRSDMPKHVHSVHEVHSLHESEVLKYPIHCN
jgi:hypothetical protein